MRSVLLSTAYLAPIQYYTKLFSYPSILIEQHENYSKQSYRNRCVILSANGPLTLTIPVKRTETIKNKTAQIEIDYGNRWQEIHWRAIDSAYRNSAFYFYYADEIKTIYLKKIPSLLQFNSILQETICNLLGIKPEVQFTGQFDSKPLNSNDFRDSIHPKPRLFKPDPTFVPVEYYQVFQNKFGFVPNLSILDLLFNMGNESSLVLNNCLIKTEPQ